MQKMIRMALAENAVLSVNLAYRPLRNGQNKDGGVQVLAQEYVP